MTQDPTHVPIKKKIGMFNVKKIVGRRVGNKLTSTGRAASSTAGDIPNALVVLPGALAKGQVVSRMEATVLPDHPPIPDVPGNPADARSESEEGSPGPRPSKIEKQKNKNINDLGEMTGLFCLLVLRLSMHQACAD